MQFLNVALLLAMLAVLTTPALAADAVLFEASCRLDLGADVGQNFGTLLEVRNAQGRVVAGAGFPGVYNTHVRNERYNLQFYVRPPADPAPAELKVHSRPNQTLGGTYLFDHDGRLYSFDYTCLKVWEGEAGQWRDDPVLNPAQAARGDGVVRVGDGRLVYTRSTVRYNDQVILPAPAEGDYYRHYYANGFLCFYHTKPGTGDGRTSLYACPWEPSDGRPVDLAQAQVLQLTYTGETPFAWGQLRNQVVTCANTGGFYMFDGTWHVLRQPDKRVSYQIYSMVNFGDKLLMGQYPSGNLFEYDGAQITPLKDWPPVMPGVSGSARECQSSAIYRGELYVGVWPWAEVWRYDRDGGQWRLVGRGFTRPPITDKFTHPYEEDIRAYNEANKASIVINDWGQRANSMTALGGDLYIGTSAKGLFNRNEKLAFLTDEVFAEYGRVLRLTLPGNLSVNLTNANVPLELRFVVTKDAMRIFRDGKLLAEQALTPDFAGQVAPASIAWREGVFGPLRGSARQLRATVPVARRSAMQPRIVQKDAFTIMGVIVRGNPAKLDYHGIWMNQYMKYDAALKPLSLDGAHYSAYFCSGKPDEVEMLAGMMVPPEAQVLAGLTKREVAGGQFAVFDCTHGTIGQTWGAVEKWLQTSDYEYDRNDRSDYELFPPDTADENSPVQIYVPVKPKRN